MQFFLHSNSIVTICCRLAVKSHDLHVKHIEIISKLSINIYNLYLPTWAFWSFAQLFAKLKQSKKTQIILIPKRDDFHFFLLLCELEKWKKPPEKTCVIAVGKVLLQLECQVKGEKWWGQRKDLYFFSL